MEYIPCLETKPAWMLGYATWSNDSALLLPSRPLGSVTPCSQCVRDSATEALQVASLHEQRPVSFYTFFKFRPWWLAASSYSGSESVPGPESCHKSRIFSTHRSLPYLFSDPGPSGLSSWHRVRWVAFNKYPASPYLQTGAVNYDVNSFIILVS